MSVLELLFLDLLGLKKLVNQLSLLVFVSDCAWPPGGGSGCCPAEWWDGPAREAAREPLPPNEHSGGAEFGGLKLKGPKPGNRNYLHQFLSPKPRVMLELFRVMHELFFLSCWPTRDHIGRSTGISNPAWHLPQAIGSVHPQPSLPNCQLCINTEPTTSIGRLIKSSRL